MSRRTFLVGSVSGLTVLAVAACTEQPLPTPTPSVPTTRSPIPQPSAFARSAWGDDAFARGSMSYLPVGATPEHRTALREPVEGRIFLAGEHTAELGAGTLQGARSAGRQAAAAVIDVAEQGERIAVVGAGLAGATAARILADEGFDVVVVEARERVGGRIDTVELGEWPFSVELGAGVVYDEAATALRMALDTADVEVLPLDPVTELRTRAGAVLETSEVGEGAVERALGWAQAQPVDLSLADAIVESGEAQVSDRRDETGVSDADRLEHHVLAGVVAASGADADALSAWFSELTPAVNEGDELVVGGLQRLVTEELDGIDILPSSPVSYVTTTERGVSLRLVRGESYSADRVVVTVPLGVLKAGSIEFDPPLPFSHRGAIAALGMGVQEKLVLRFEEPFWSTDATVWGVVDGDSDFPLWINLQPATGEPVLVGLTAGEAALRLASFDDQEFLGAALASLEPFLDPSLASPQPSDGVGG